MRHDLPQILKRSEQLMVEIEQAVRGFPRYHKFATGQRIRDLAFEVTALGHQAWTDRDQRAAVLQRLVVVVDQLKVALQLGSRLKAFNSFGQFEAIARLAADVGRQARGWSDSQHRKGAERHAR